MIEKQGDEIKTPFALRSSCAAIVALKKAKIYCVKVKI